MAVDLHCTIGDRRGVIFAVVEALRMQFPQVVVGRLVAELRQDATLGCINQSQIFSVVKCQLAPSGKRLSPSLGKSIMQDN